jgi:hypothetical protein
MATKTKEETVVKLRIRVRAYENKIGKANYRYRASLRCENCRTYSVTN